MTAQEIDSEDLWPSSQIDWQPEVKRAVDYARHKGLVPADAAPMLAEATLATLQRLLEGLLAGVPELEPMPAQRADLAEWMQRNGEAVQAQKRALWGHLTVRDGVTERGPVPLDEALAAELERLGDAKAASAVHKSSTELASNTLSKGEQSAWRTHHRTLHGLVHSPSGESWPPNGCALAMWNDGPGLWVEGVLPWYNEGTRAKVAELWEGAKKAIALEEQKQREDNGIRRSNTPPASLQRVWWFFAQAVWQAPWVVEGWVPPVRLLSLALALWEHGGVKAKWEARQAKHAALTRGVTSNVVEVLSPARQVEMPLDGEWRVRSADGKAVAFIDGEAAALLSRAEDLDLLSTVWAGRLIDLVVNTAHDQHEAGNGDFRRVAFRGGLAALRDAIGYQKSGNADLEKLLHIGAGLRVEGPGMSAGGLWTWMKTRGGPGKPGEVTLVLSDVLCPQNPELWREPARRLSASQRQARRLVPVLATPPPYQAAGVNARDFGRVYASSRGLLMHYRDNVRAEDGAAPLPPDALRRIVEKAGLDGAAREAVLEVWVEGDGERPALLEKDGTDVRLTDTHAAAREFMRRGAERQESGRKRGKAHAKHKAARGGGGGRK